jgi:hypothetical protein
MYVRVKVDKLQVRYVLFLLRNVWTILASSAFSVLKFAANSPSFAGRENNERFREELQKESCAYNDIVLLGCLYELRTYLLFNPTKSTEVQCRKKNKNLQYIYRCKRR